MRPRRRTSFETFFLISGEAVHLPTVDVHLHHPLCRQLDLAFFLVFVAMYYLDVLLLCRNVHLLPPDTIPSIAD